MTEKDYLQKKEALYKQISELKRQYIESNITIQPGRVVAVKTISGETKVWLHSYKVTAGAIDPIYYRLKPDGTPSKNRVYFSYKASMREV